MESIKKQFLVHFTKKFRYLDFCLNELEALADMNGVKREELFVQPKESLRNIFKSPTVYVRLPGDEVCKRIVSRSVLIKEIVEVRLI